MINRGRDVEFADDEEPFPEDEELAQGEDDRALLRAVLDRQDRDTDEFEAFWDMLDALVARRYKSLTPKQRAWLERVGDRLGVPYTPRGEEPIRAADVPRGREVETPAILRDLPKSPPGRRASPDPDPQNGADLVDFAAFTQDEGDR